MGFSLKRDANMIRAFERQFTACREAIPQAKSEVLLESFEELHRTMAQLDMAAELLGLHDDPCIEQQYRLTVSAVEQELLKRLSVSS
jgi:hypothetical protein